MWLTLGVSAPEDLLAVLGQVLAAATLAYDLLRGGLKKTIERAFTRSIVLILG